LSGITISTAGKSCTTGGNGRCSIYLPPGTYNIAVKDEREVPKDEKMRYLLLNRAAFLPIQRGIKGVKVDSEHNVVNVPLAQGFLLWISDRTVPIIVDPNEGDYFDHDPGPDALWWNGTRLPAPRPHIPSNVHPGTDYKMPEGTPLYAAAPGVIYYVNIPKDGSVAIIAIDFGNGYAAAYLHISRATVRVGQRVNAGDLIGYSGSTGPSLPHTEFQLYKWGKNREEAYCIDPYVPVETPYGRGAWLWHAGTWEWVTFNEDWPVIGYWTVKNNPQPPN
jgi:murein DD-endopeptidase MepM/ murein hydrolase activator NlpD